MSFWNAFRQDLAFALRGLRRDPAFFSAALAIVALGIGANTAIFSLVNGILFRPLPFQEAGRLVWIANAEAGDGGLSSVTTRVGTYLDWRRLNQSFEDLTNYFAFFDYGTYTLTGNGEAERLSGVGVAQNFLPFLGVRPALGRNFEPAETTDNAALAVILTDGLWRRRFGADPGVIGRGMTLNDSAATVIGVLPADFDFRAVFTPGARVDMLVPFPATPRTDRYGNTLAVIGRLKPGVTVRQAQNEFDLLNPQIFKEHPERGPFGARLTPLRQHLTSRSRQGLVLLLGAVGLVLLIACANLSNLLLARATSRRKEIAIRSAMGASRGRLIGQMLTESLLTSSLGAALGLGLAWLAVRALAGLGDVSIPLLATVKMDSAALGFTVLAAAAAGLLMGIVPALDVSAVRQAETLKDASRGASEGRRGGWIRASLVTAQVALACVLLVGAGLLIRSFSRVLDTNLGFRPERAAAWRVETGQRYQDKAARLAFFERLAARVENVPGVDAVGITDALPLGRDRSWGLAAKGVQYGPGQYPLGHPRLIDWRYPKAMGIRLVAGRLFEERDTATSERVVLINEKAARRLWPGEEAVGKIAVIDGERRVVGVVANVRHQTPEQEADHEMYIPLAQNNSNSVEMVVRSRTSLAAIAPAVRAAMREVDPQLPVAEYQTLEAMVDRAVSPRRFLMMLLALFAIAALLLASVGIYAVISYSVGLRAQEIGIRMALGAPAEAVRKMVMVRTIALAAIGIAVGSAAAWVLSRWTGSLLYGLEPGDPVSFAIAVGVLVLVALAAGYWPARRASKVDRVMVLRG